MKILITGDGEFLRDSHEHPKVGRRYYLLDAETYTQPMRNLWEALVTEAFKSGKFSYDTLDRKTFREYIKRDYGPPHTWEYVAMDYRIVECNRLEDIPADVALDWSKGNTSRIRVVDRSSTSYSMSEMYQMIDNTINAMYDHGVSTPKFLDIIEEINREKAS